MPLQKDSLKNQIGQLAPSAAIKFFQ